jgi:hypothetical protein
MTRKDYELIAAAIERSDTVYDAAWNLCLALSQDNERFKAELFMKACGFTGAFK